MQRNSARLEEQDHEQLLKTVRRLLAEAEALSSRIAAVNEIGIAINRKLDLDKILTVVAKQAKWLLDFDYCGVCLRGTNGLWKISDLYGFTSPCSTAELNNSPNLGYVLKTGYAYLTSQIVESSFLRSYASQIILPLVNDSEVMGTINFAMRRSGAYSQEDLRIGHLLALQLAAAIRNARFVENMEIAEEGLRQYAQELEVRNAELDAYGHTIAHDLKSPLTSIPLRVYMVEKLQPDLKPEAVKQLQEIKNSTQHMAKMIDQLLWLAKLRHPGEAIQKVEVTPALEAALARFQQPLIQQGIQIQYDSPLPPVKAHSQWLEEIFANLISNAIKYMGAANPQPSITIRGTCQGNMVRYEVADSGLGIPEDKQAHLFEMFTREHIHEAEGLGLGLSIVHRIINNLNGQVGVESTPGVGSTFWFTLPAAE